MGLKKNEKKMMHHLKMKDTLLFQTETVQFQANEGYVLSGIRYVPNQT